MEKIKAISRRRFMSYSLAASGLYLLNPAKLLVAQNGCPPTRPDILGPYYRPNAPFRDVLGDATLVVYGTVMSTSCEPIPGALLEIWQANPQGEYDYTGEDYNYYAELYSEDDGSYLFYTDIPGLYPQRPIRHIHYRVSADGFQVLVTQQYFERDTTKTEAPFDFVLIPKG